MHPARNHQSCLSCDSKLPFYERSFFKGDAEVVIGPFWTKQLLPFRQIHILKLPQAEHETIVVDRHEGIAAFRLLQALRDDSRERVVGGATDERMKKVMAKFPV